MPGRVFGDLEHFNVQLAGWRMSDLRIHGTMQQPIDSVADEARDPG